MIKTRYTNVPGFAMIRGVKHITYPRGQATLSFILLVSGVVLQIALAGSVVTYFLSSSKFSERLSLRALAAAQAGVRDAEIRVSRDNNYAALGNITYSFDVGSDTVSVTVSRTSDNPNNAYVYTVTSIGTASLRKKKLVGVIVADQTTGLLHVKSIEEQSF